MNPLKLLTWNLRGLRNKIKRITILTFLKSQWADVITLVETHVTGHLQSFLKWPCIRWAYHATHTSYISKGTLKWYRYRRTSRADMCFYTPLLIVLLF